MTSRAALSFTPSSRSFAEYGQKKRILSRKYRQKHTLLLHQSFLLMLLHEDGCLPLVFLPIQGTGDIEQRASGQKMAPCMFKDPGLCPCGFLESLR